METQLANIEIDENKQKEEDIPPSNDVDGELEQSEKQNRHKRHQRFQSSLNWIVIISLWLIFGSVVLSGGIYLFHMLTTEKWHFLNPIQLEQVRTFVVTALLSSSLTNYANRHINDE